MTQIKDSDFGHGIDFPAKQLSHEDLGSLVTIKLPSGAQITDILEAVIVGINVRNGAVHSSGLVNVRLANTSPENGFGGTTGWDLDPESDVWAQRPVESVPE